MRRGKRSEKEKASDKQYRADHPELYSGIRRAKQLKTKEPGRGAKDRPCADCGNLYPFYVMDFDHAQASIRYSRSPRGSRVTTAPTAQPMMAELA